MSNIWADGIERLYKYGLQTKNKIHIGTFWYVLLSAIDTFYRSLKSNSNLNARFNKYFHTLASGIYSPHNVSSWNTLVNEKMDGCCHGELPRGK